MNKKEAEQKQILIYWWNLGTKTLDYEGSYKGFLENKNIKIKRVKKNVYKAEFSAGTSTFGIANYVTDFVDLFNLAIKSYLQYLGDKTLFIDGYGRTYRLNWR